MLDVLAGRFRVTARMFFVHSLALRHRLLCACPVTDEQTAEHHELCRDETREHRQRLNRPHESKITPNNSTVSSNLPISPSHAERIIAFALSSRLGCSTRAARKPFGTTAVIPPSNADIPATLADPNPCHRRNHEAHARLHEQRQWHDVLHVNHHNGPLAMPCLAEGLGGIRQVSHAACVAPFRPPAF